MAVIASLAVALTAKTNKFRSGMRRGQKSLGKFRGGVKRTRAALNGLGKSLTGLKSKFAAIAAVAGAGLALRSIITTGAKFEQTMSKVNVLLSATTAEFKSLSNTAKDLGASTQFSASQAAEGMASFALAGFKTKEILDAMKPTLALAAAGELSVGEAADISAKIMAGMGIKASDLTGTVDVMAKAFTTANTDLRMLGAALGYIGPIAKAAKRPLEEVVAGIQLLSNAGIQGEQAGTTLRAMLLKLTNPAAEAQKIMARLSLSFKDANGDLKGLPSIIGDLDNALSGLGSAEQLEILGKLFGAKAASGASALISQGGDKFRDFVTKLRDSAGTADKVSGGMLNNLAGDWTEFGSAVEGVVINVFESIGPSLRKLVQSSTKGISDFANSAKTTFRNIGLAVSHFTDLALKQFGAMRGSFNDSLIGVLEDIEKLDSSGALDGFIRNVKNGFTGLVLIVQTAFSGIKRVAGAILLAAGAAQDLSNLGSNLADRKKILADINAFDKAIARIRKSGDLEGPDSKFAREEIAVYTAEIQKLEDKIRGINLQGELTRTGKKLLTEGFTDLATDMNAALDKVDLNLPENAKTGVLGNLRSLIDDMKAGAKTGGDEVGKKVGGGLLDGLKGILNASKTAAAKAGNTSGASFADSLLGALNAKKGGLIKKAADFTGGLAKTALGKLTAGVKFVTDEAKKVADERKDTPAASFTLPAALTRGSAGAASVAAQAQLSGRDRIIQEAAKTAKKQREKTNSLLSKGLSTKQPVPVTIGN
jgi:TP901 family phage tail tape measure protein